MDLFEAIMAGDAAKALDELGGQYADGADPVAVLRDLAEITHWLSVISITAEAAEDPTISPDERTRGLALAEKLPMRVLTRMWQMLLKALEEVAIAPNAMMAAEMAVIRLTHVAELPTPGDLVKKLGAMDRPSGGAPAGGGGGGPALGPGPQARASGSAPMGGGGPQAMLAPQAGPDLSVYPTFESVVALVEQARDIKLLIEVKTGLRLVSYEPGRIEVQTTETAPKDLIPRLGRMLQTATGARWGITVASEGGGETIEEQEQGKRREMEAEVTEHPLMQAVLSRFPNAKIAEIRSHAEIEAEAAVEALEEAEDWDPFEDE
jgi:DNA polymerase-3 subunit gamma/tau